MVDPNFTVHPPNAIAVIFVSHRTAQDEAEYALAAKEMDRLAAGQDGYLGLVSTRGEDGVGITVSYWRDEAAAKAWRDNPRHVEIREHGRAGWYSDYSLHVAKVERAYAWP